VLLHVALAAVLVRSAIPLGFMPAPLSSGWLLQLCPGGLNAHDVEILLGPHAHHHGGDAESDATDFENCPLGLLLGAIGLCSSDAAGTGASLVTLRIVDLYVSPLLGRHIAPYSSRDPPVLEHG